MKSSTDVEVELEWLGSKHAIYGDPPPADHCLTPCRSRQCLACEDNTRRYCRSGRWRGRQKTHPNHNLNLVDSLRWGPGAFDSQGFCQNFLPAVGFRPCGFCHLAMNGLATTRECHPDQSLHVHASGFAALLDPKNRLDPKAAPSCTPFDDQRFAMHGQLRSAVRDVQSSRASWIRSIEAALRGHLYPTIPFVYDLLLPKTSCSGLTDAMGCRTQSRHVNARGIVAY